MIPNLSNNLLSLHKRETVTKMYEQLASNTPDIVKWPNVMLIKALHPPSPVPGATVSAKPSTHFQAAHPTAADQVSHAGSLHRSNTHTHCAYRHEQASWGELHTESRAITPISEHNASGSTGFTPEGESDHAAAPQTYQSHCHLSKFSEIEGFQVPFASRASPHTSFH